MNREIEFRGKRCADGECVYGDYVTGDSCDVSFIFPRDITSLFCVGGRYEVDENTVGEFTGLEDYHGVKIFEGDIVECVSWNEYFTNLATGEVMQPFRRKMYVDFRKGGFKMVEPMPEPMKDNEWDIIYNGDIVVIGNRYDNPELLAAK